MSFDRIAPFFRPLEWMAFRRAMMRARTHELAALDGCERVLIWGEGDGRFLEALLERRLRRSESVDVIVVDESLAMIKMAKERTKRFHTSKDVQVHFLHGEATTLSHSAPFDAFVTHFFLDCFRSDEVSAHVAFGARHASEKAVWLLADFDTPPGGWAGLYARAWLWTLYRFFRWTTGITGRRLVDPSLFLGLNGFHLKKRTHFHWGLIKSDQWRRG